MYNAPGGGPLQGPRIGQKRSTDPGAITKKYNYKAKVTSSRPGPRGVVDNLWFYTCKKRKSIRSARLRFLLLMPLNTFISYRIMYYYNNAPWNIPYLGARGRDSGVNANPAWWPICGFSWFSLCFP